MTDTTTTTTGPTTRLADYWTHLDGSPCLTSTDDGNRRDVSGGQFCDEHDRRVYPPTCTCQAAEGGYASHLPTCPAYTHRDRLHDQGLLDTTVAAAARQAADEIAALPLHGNLDLPTAMEEILAGVYDLATQHGQDDVAEAIGGLDTDQGRYPVVTSLLSLANGLDPQARATVEGLATTADVAEVIDLLDKGNPWEPVWEATAEDLGVDDLAPVTPLVPTPPTPRGRPADSTHPTPGGGATEVYRLGTWEVMSLGLALSHWATVLEVSGSDQGDPTIGAHLRDLAHRIAGDPTDEPTVAIVVTRPTD